jgi:hypothetical protein
VVLLKAPRNARPIGVRAVETITASRMELPVALEEKGGLKIRL